MAPRKQKAFTGKLPPWHGGAPPIKGFVYDQKIAEYIVEEMYQGRTWISILSEPGMPSRSTCHTWEREHADFREAVKLARRANGTYYFERGHEAVEEAGQTTPNPQSGAPPKPYWVAFGQAGFFFRMAAMRAPDEFSERREKPKEAPNFQPDEEAQREILATLNERLRKKSNSG